MDTPNRWRPPDLASWRVFSVIVALLLGALALEIALSPHCVGPVRGLSSLGVSFIHRTPPAKG